MKRVLIALLVVLGACSAKKPGEGGKKSWPLGSGRVQAFDCPKQRAPGNAQPDNQGDCKQDGDCTAGQNGRCNVGGSRMPTNLCSYDSCFVDADCKGKGPCECNQYGGNACLEGNCQVDADCASGSCGRSNFVGCWGGSASYWCRSNKDTCVEDDDCGKGPPYKTCAWDGKRFSCVEHPQCPVG